MRTTAFFLGPVFASVAVLGCSKRDTSSAAATDSAAATPSTSAPATSAPATSASASASAAGDSTVRGSVVAVSDTLLTVGMPAGGDVRVALVPPVQVYARESADRSKVTEHTFIGVTSVPQPDGTQRATEIHIFPDELRGLGEGSRPMGQPAGGGSRSTMTNGAVRSTMTNGTVAARGAASSGSSRMTNGAVRTQGGSTITVDYQGGSQTIIVPAGVTVTAIAPTKAPLTPGTNVIVLATKRPDGSLQSSRVMLAPPRPRP